MKAQYIPSYVCIFVSTDLSHNNKSKKAKKKKLKKVGENKCRLTDFSFFGEKPLS